MFISCDVAKTPVLTVAPESITLYKDGTRQITTNAEDAIFETEDDFYASVDEMGLVTANKVGKTNIFINSSYGEAVIPVTIMPQYSLYPDVDQLVGKSLNDIVRIMGSSYETTSDNGSIFYTYVAPSSYCDLLSFNTENGICTSILAMIPSEYTNKLVDALAERYTVAGMLNDYFFFLNHDQKTIIAVMVYSYSYLAVLYTEYTEDTKSSTNNKDYSAILNMFNKWIN